MEGATVYFTEDVPRHLSIGIDFFFFDSHGAKVRGVKLVSEGVHFLHCSDYTENHRFGCFLSCKAGDMFVVELKESSMEIVLVADSEGTVVDGAELEEGEKGVESMAVSKYMAETSNHIPFLVNYAQFTGNQWAAVTGDISWVQIRHILRQVGYKVSRTASTTDSSKQENDSLYSAIKDAGKARGDLEDPILASLKEDTATELDFFPIDLKRTIRPNASVEQVTHDYLDKSWYLANVVLGKTDFLSEFEISFVFVLVLNNFNSYRQWMNMALVALGCSDYVRENQRFFLSFVSVWKTQLDVLPKEMIDTGAGDGLVDLTHLSSALAHFIAVARENGIGINDLVQLLRDKFGLEIVDSDDEYDDDDDYIV